MSSNERKKMCSTCDGMIPMDAIMCPYCSAALWENHTERSTTAQTPSFKQQQPLNNSFSSHYTPPYSSKDQTNNEGSTAVKKKPESFKNAHRIDTNVTSVAGLDEVKEEQAQTSQKSIFWAILMLSLAVNFVLLGFLQFFFSDNGILRLEWQSSYWFIYCLVSLPLFYFGIKKVNALN